MKGLYHNMRALVIFLLLLAALPALAIEDINQPDQKVDITEHLTKGRRAIVFFYSRSDKTANRIQVRLAQFDNEDDDWDILRVRLRKLNSPVAKQHGITQVPAFILYNEDGQVMSRGNEAFSTVLNMLESP